ncbi:tetratricopeptide repeat protein [Sedimentitalea todarodis]|uniref:Tetratricopeptide repeat protein n=1 Tax=Sedimentitalea todarodis TaxID=1631240 RepID=A0ABU3VBQ0_9RHOB|nr:tetratricopeptide repeat protein [Sedimentitalea todarodis]MDU9003605.1 tetratricopeptide repeat protein [Sedimentitalea todarodis]
MSDSDSFIEEVTEEVRRDRLFLMFRRYGWIAVVLIVIIVAGAAWNEYSKAQTRAAAETLGDGIVAALAANDPAARAAALSEVEADTPGGEAVVNFLIAAAEVNSGETTQAVARLNEIAINGDVPEIYRQIASFKALTLQADSMPVEERRVQFEALAQPGAPLRLLAEEQLALIDVSEDEIETAVVRLQAILDDSEVTTDLQQRVSQLMVALGATPQVPSRIQG